MVSQKDSASPCGWYSRPWFVLLLKPNVRTSPQRHSLWLQSQVSHCNTDTNDYIKAVSSILTHRLLSQPVHTEGSQLSARDYTVVSKRNSRVRGTAHNHCRIQYVPSCNGERQKRDCLLPVPVFIQILPQEPALRWNLNDLRCSEKNPCNAWVSC